MWIRSLASAGLAVAVIGGLAAEWLRYDRVAEPESFDPGRYQRADFARVIGAVDAAQERRWEEAGVEPLSPAPDLAIARRLSLGLTGTVPSLEELRAWEAVPEEHRVDWWVSHLLEDRRYADYVAERLARAYVGTEEGPFLVYRRRRFVSWLSDQLMANVPYDQLVREMITGEGLWTDTPAVNFITVTVDQNETGKPDVMRLAGRTSRAFLGMRIDCLQCHDDRLGNVELGSDEAPRYGEQQDFHQLAAYFAECELGLTGVRDVEQDYAFEYLGEESEEIVPPRLPFLPELRRGGDRRREELARWVTHRRNRAFSRVAVNRVWALLYGRPLVEPIDDIPLHGDVPAELDLLAEDFAEHDFDLQRLIRVIAATRSFQVDSQGSGVSRRHEEVWAAFPLTRLRPEQVAGGLIQSCSLTTIDADAHIVSKLARFFQQGEFINRYGDPGEEEFSDQSGTVTQRLLMMNGELVQERTGENLLANAATQIALVAPDDESAVEIAFLSVLTRRPSPDVQRHFAERLRGTQGDARSRVLEDLYWALLNTTEFSWNH